MSRTSRRMFGGLLALGLGLDAACAPEAARAEAVERSVLLICLDTVRADHLGSYGYATRPTTPHLDALAETGLVFTDVVAASGWTKPSVPSYFTGTPPAVHGVYEGSTRRGGELSTDVLGDEAETLAERFAERGHATAAFVRNAQLAPGSGMDQGFELYVDEAGDAVQIVDQALAWLDARVDGPFFLYLHILDAHWPYHVPDAAAERFAEPGVLERFRSADWKQLRDSINAGEVPIDAEQEAELLALYDGALAYADAQIGRLLEGLESRQLRERTVISVVSDHGEEFLEHGRIGHGHGLYETLTDVPWIVAGPGVPAREVTTPVSLLDLGPTLLAAVSDDDPGFDPAAIAVNRLAAPERAARLFSEHKGPDVYMQSLRRGTLKLVRVMRARERREGGDDPVGAHLALGGRWEAELAGDRDELRALQLKPRREDEGDPVELKAELLARFDDRLHFAHWTARLSPEAEFAGTLTSASGIVPGAVIKLSGHFDGETFLAQRAKGYDGESLDAPEIRAPLVLLEGDGGAGVVRLGPLRIRYDASTRFKGLPDGAPKPLLERAEIARLHEIGLAAMVAAGYPAELRVFDLVADPLEQHPLRFDLGADTAPPAHVARLSDELDALGAQFALRRQWGEPIGHELDPDTLAELRALGYVR